MVLPCTWLAVIVRRNARAAIVHNAILAKLELPLNALTEV
jgi:hypothetical protein